MITLAASELVRQRPQICSGAERRSVPGGMRVPCASKDLIESSGFEMPSNRAGCAALIAVSSSRNGGDEGSISK
jgi:hypothetical protein